MSDFRAELKLIKYGNQYNWKSNIAQMHAEHFYIQMKQ